MEEMFGKLLQGILPWIIPLILFGSWLVNHGYGESTGGSDGGAEKKKKQTSEKKSAKIETSASPAEDSGPSDSTGE